MTRLEKALFPSTIARDGNIWAPHALRLGYGHPRMPVILLRQRVLVTIMTRFGRLGSDQAEAVQKSSAPTTRPES